MRACRADCKLTAKERAVRLYTGPIFILLKKKEKWLYKSFCLIALLKLLLSLPSKKRGGLKKHTPTCFSLCPVIRNLRICCCAFRCHSSAIDLSHFAVRFCRHCLPALVDYRVPTRGHHLAMPQQQQQHHQQHYSLQFHDQGRQAVLMLFGVARTTTHSHILSGSLSEHVFQVTTNWRFPDEQDRQECLHTLLW